MEITIDYAYTLLVVPFLIFMFLCAYLYQTDMLYYKYDIYVKNNMITYCSDNLVKYYNKWNSLTKMVSTRHKNKAYIFAVSIRILMFAFYVGILQYFNNTIVKHFKEDSYVITYMLKGRLYKLIVKPKKRNLEPYIQVIDNNGNDVTNEITMFSGPEYNFHNSDVTPFLLGYESLTFEMDDGSEITYGKNDIINIYSENKNKCITTSY